MLSLVTLLAAGLVFAKVHHVVAPPPAAPLPMAAPPVLLGPVPFVTPPKDRTVECTSLYPAAAKATGIEGSTQLSVHVAANGDLSNPKLLVSSGNTELDQAAIACVNNKGFLRPVQVGDAFTDLDWAVTIRWSLMGGTYILSPAPQNFSCASLYPGISIRIRETGTSTVWYKIATDGGVTAVAIISSSGSSRLDRAALACVLRWTFVPATRDGKPLEILRAANVVWMLPN